MLKSLAYAAVLSLFAIPALAEEPPIAPLEPYVVAEVTSCTDLASLEKGIDLVWSENKSMEEALTIVNNGDEKCFQTMLGFVPKKVVSTRSEAAKGIRFEFIEIETIARINPDGKAEDFKQTRFAVRFTRIPKSPEI